MTATDNDGGKKSNCLWVYSENGEFWDTACENIFSFEAEWPKENEFEFCPYCGGILKLSEHLK